MAYVVYNKETTTFLCNTIGVRTDIQHFATKGSAKAALTREAKSGWVDPALYDIAEAGVFYNSIERQRGVINKMTGKEMQIPQNTPLCSDPSSDTYWSM